MGKREETLSLLKNGDSPGKIAEKMGVTWKTSLNYLFQMVGEGRCRRSDIYLSLPIHQRRDPRQPVDKEVVRTCGGPKQLLGDIYEDVHFIEVTLHELIKRKLQDEFGEGEQGWWRKGVPEDIRKDCQSRREEDPEPTDKYNYTNLVDLKEIIRKHWSVFGDALPKKMSSDKQKLMKDLERLNRIRRVVMHPVRGQIPSEEDFGFLRNFSQSLEDMSKR